MEDCGLYQLNLKCFGVALAEKRVWKETERRFNFCKMQLSLCILIDSKRILLSVSFYFRTRDEQQSNSICLYARSGQDCPLCEGDNCVNIFSKACGRYCSFSICFFYMIKFILNMLKVLYALMQV